MRLEMFAAAENLEFEKAARMRDELKKLEAIAGVDSKGEVAAAFDPYPSSGRRKSSGMRGRGTAKAAGGASRGARPGQPARNGRKYKTR
jgi:excinuclease ABC subunit B